MCNTAPSFGYQSTQTNEHMDVHTGKQLKLSFPKITAKCNTVKRKDVEAFALKLSGCPTIFIPKDCGFDPTVFCNATTQLLNMSRNHKAGKGSKTTAPPEYVTALAQAHSAYTSEQIHYFVESKTQNDANPSVYKAMLGGESPLLISLPYILHRVCHIHNIQGSGGFNDLLNMAVADITNPTLIGDGSESELLCMKREDICHAALDACGLCVQWVRHKENLTGTLWHDMVSQVAMPLLTLAASFFIIKRIGKAVEEVVNYEHIAVFECVTQASIPEFWHYVNKLRSATARQAVASYIDTETYIFLVEHMRSEHSVFCSCSTSSAHK